MANQHTSVWTRTPHLHATAAKLVADGQQGKALERAIHRQCKVAITSNAIFQHLGRCQGTCGQQRLSVVDALLEPENGYAASVVPTYAKGWEPRVEESGNEATAVSPVLSTPNPEEDELIRGWQLDPAHWRIVGPLGVNRWQTPIPTLPEACACSPRLTVKHHESRWNYQYKARLERIEPVREADIASLVEEIRAHVFVPGPRAVGDDAFLVGIADTQMGKPDGDGIKGTADRFLETIGRVSERVRELRLIGRKLGTLYVAGMGDLIESCDGHYAQQTFRVGLNRREQVTVMRRLILRALQEWSTLFERVVVPCVGGNHGENRKDGKSFTDFADNDDVAIFEQIQEIMAANPGYSHVEFMIPRSELALTLDIAGVGTAITHGHIFGKGSGGIAQKAINWWAKQAHGQQPAGNARLLISAHYHHLLISETGSKVHIQCPAMEGGSEWWRDLSGQDSRPGMLTLRIGENVSLTGYADAEVL